MAQPLLEETRNAMGKARNSLDPNTPQFSQVELCEVAEIPMATANNWILTGALRPADVGSRRARKPRLFSVVTIYEAKVTGDLVKWLGTPPPIAAGMARKTTDGHNWHWSIPRDLGGTTRAISSRLCFGLTNAATGTPRWTSLLATCCGLR